MYIERESHKGCVYKSRIFEYFIAAIYTLIHFILKNRDNGLDPPNLHMWMWSLASKNKIFIILVQ